MKKQLIFISILAIGFSFGAKAQFISAQDLPADISQDFSAKYPTLSKVDWEKDGKHYKATFSVKNYAHQLVYDVNGKLVTEEAALPVAALPADVTSGLKKNFPDFEIKDASQLTDKGHVSFKLSIKDENNAVESVILAPDGRVIKTIIDPDQQ